MVLKDGLAAFWELEESSGTRVDSPGSSNLTDNNTVTSGVGVLGNAADFEKNASEYLSRADNAAVSIAGNANKSFVLWVKLETASALQYFVSKWSNGTGFDYQIATDTPNNPYFVVRNAANTGNAVVTNTSLGGLSPGTWYMLYCYHDADNDQMGFSVNAGTVDTTSFSGGVNDTGTAFHVGANNTPANYYDGMMDQFGIWDRVLTSAEISFLYNNGNGRSYTEILAGLPPDGMPFYF